MAVHLESWVTQQYKEIGFGNDGVGPFIGKAALKRELISRYPMHKGKIRQLINAYAKHSLAHSESAKLILSFNSIKHQDIPRGSIPTSLPITISSQTEEISKSTATPSLSKFKIASEAQVGASSLSSDSGFESRSEDAGNVRDLSFIPYHFNVLITECRVRVAQLEVTRTP